MFALVDCNNFYVSCERVFQPRLENLPLLFYQITMDVSSLEVMKQKLLVYQWERLAFKYLNIFKKKSECLFIKLSTLRRHESTYNENSQYAHTKY